MTSESLYGQDIQVDSDLDAALSASGEMIVTTSERAALQDIKARIETPVGGLFYDAGFGSNLIVNLYDENTETVRQQIVLEVESVIEQDPRVVIGSVAASVKSWDEKTLTIETFFRLIDDTNTYNLVVAVGQNTVRVLDDTSR